MPAGTLLFPFSLYWDFYLLFILLVFAMLAIDLGVFHRKTHVVTFKESLLWTIVWITLALAFNVGLYYYCLNNFPTNERLLAIPGFDPTAMSKEVGLEFLTGYIIEKSLAVDNIFVFVVVFSYFHIPLQYQHRVLFYGILGALLFRAIFIALGAVLMQYQAVIIIFGAFLIFTGIKMAFAPEKKMEPEKNPLLKLLRKMVPITKDFHGQSFFIRENGKLFGTPLLVALVFVELSDIIFAIDSVPAIFAITSEPFLVFTSNIFAILGLRSMYFMLANVVEKFIYLKYGLSAVLVFVGLKMVWLNKAFDGHFPITWSLGIIGGIIGISIALSFLFPRKDPIV
jgi:tellurite resistance protein TerC